MQGAGAGVKAREEDDPREGSAMVGEREMAIPAAIISETPVVRLSLSFVHLAFCGLRPMLLSTSAREMARRAVNP